MANKYLTFDGLTGYVTVPNDAALNFGTGDFSICLWAKNISNNHDLFGKYDFSCGAGYGVDFENNMVFFVVKDSVPAGSVLTAPISQLKVGWNFLVFLRNSLSVKMYFNGILVAEKSVAAVNCDTVFDLSIGRNQIIAHFDGSLDDIRLYKGVALTQEQVDIIYNSGTGKKYDVADAGAGLAFNFDEGTGNPVSTGTAELTGTITDGVTWQSGGVPFVGSIDLEMLEMMEDF